MLNDFKIKIRDWSIEHIHGTRAKFWLAIFSFSEASFFLIPPDIFLVAILAVSAQRWIFYSAFTTVFSVLGGILGYVLGALFFDTLGESIISFYNLQEQMLFVAEKFSDNAFWAIFISALTPIPYKVFTISAGFFKIDFATFMIASILGRGIRFFAVGFIMKKFGKPIMSYIFKYFDIISVLTAIAIVLLLFLN